MRNPPDLLLVTGAFPVRSQSFIENKAIALARAGHNVTVLAARPGDHTIDPSAAAELGDRLHVRYRPYGRRGRRIVRSAAMAVSAIASDPRFAGQLVHALLRRHGLTFQFWRRLERGLILGGRPQTVVHFEWATKAAEYVDAIELLGAATVVSCRGTDVHILANRDERFAADLRRVFAAADAVHCVSHATLAAAEALGLDRSKAFVNHPAVDCDRFDGTSDIEEPSGALSILSVGRVHWVKGYDDALRAIRLLTDLGLDVTYTIVGPGDPASTDALSYAVRELQLQDRVYLVGPQSRDAVKQFVARSSIFFLPSRSEGLSNSALEAMAMARPVVATDVGGMSELIRDGIHGFLVPSRDVTAMADRLQQLVLDVELRAKMGKEARMRVCDSFSLPAQIAAFVEVYHRLDRSIR